MDFLFIYLMFCNQFEFCQRTKCVSILAFRYYKIKSLVTKTTSENKINDSILKWNISKFYNFALSFPRNSFTFVTDICRALSNFWHFISVQSLILRIRFGFLNFEYFGWFNFRLCFWNETLVKFIEVVNHNSLLDADV